jgi:hypothetical protein
MTKEPTPVQESEPKELPRNEREDILDPHSNLARFAIEFINQTAAREMPAGLTDAQIEVRNGQLFLWTRYDRDIRRPLPDPVVTSGPLSVGRGDDADVRRSINDAAATAAAQQIADAEAKRLEDIRIANEAQAKREQEARDVAFAQVDGRPGAILPSDSVKIAPTQGGGTSQEDAKAKIERDTAEAEADKAAQAAKARSAEAEADKAAQAAANKAAQAADKSKK